MTTPSHRPLLVILISGRGSNLRSLVRARADGVLDCDIAGVVSNRPDAAGLAWAAGQGIATASAFAPQACATARTEPGAPMRWAISP